MVKTTRSEFSLVLNSINDIEAFQIHTCTSTGDMPFYSDLRKCNFSTVLFSFMCTLRVIPVLRPHGWLLKTMYALFISMFFLFPGSTDTHLTGKSSAGAGDFLDSTTRFPGHHASCIKQEQISQTQRITTRDSNIQIWMTCIKYIRLNLWLIFPNYLLVS